MEIYCCIHSFLSTLNYRYKKNTVIFESVFDAETISSFSAEFISLLQILLRLPSWLQNLILCYLACIFVCWGSNFIFLKDVIMWDMPHPVSWNILFHLG